MARVTRSSVLLWLQDVLGIQSGAQAPPVETPNTIQPVVDVGPKVSTLGRNLTRATTGSGTIFTTPTDKDFYITAACLSLTKDATSDGTAAYLGAVLGGRNVNLLNIACQTTTAYSNNVSLSFPYPIKVDRNSNIFCGMTFSAGTSAVIGSFVGFVLE